MNNQSFRNWRRAHRLEALWLSSLQVLRRQKNIPPSVWFRASSTKQEIIQAYLCYERKRLFDEVRANRQSLKGVPPCL